MNPFKIIISQRVDVIKDRNEKRDALDHRLFTFFEEMGALCFQMPNALTDSSRRNWIKAVEPNAVVLSGGNDIGDFPERDKTEKSLMDYAALNRLPLLGICRGMQMLAHCNGTTLLKVQGHVKSRHEIQFLDRNSFSREVNSYHNQALSSCPRDYKVTAKSSDNNIEAIRHLSLPWEGWMWHPERELPFSEHDKERIRRLFGI